jgi:sec-independent protein translocase protein TatA
MNLPVAFLQMNELMWVALIVLILFGGSRIPALMRSIGRGAGEFQKGVDEGKKLMDQAKQEALSSPSEPESKTP